MTDESKSSTEPWIADKGAKYPYAYDPGGKLHRAMGVRGIPHAVLVDPAGQIVYAGNPGGLTDEVIRKHLDGAMKKPAWEWPKEAAGIKKPFAKKQLAQALAEAEKAIAKSPDVQDLADIKASLEKLVANRLAAVKAAKEAGNFLGASRLAERLAKDAAGLPAADEAAALAKEIGADPAAKQVIAGQTAVEKLRAKEPEKEKDVKAALKKLAKLQEEHAGTAAASDAAAFAAELEELLKQRP